jgi:hypothetical protein
MEEGGGKMEEGRRETRRQGDRETRENKFR